MALGDVTNVGSDAATAAKAIEREWGAAGARARAVRAGTAAATALSARRGAQDGSVAAGEAAAARGGPATYARRRFPAEMVWSDDADRRRSSVFVGRSLGYRRKSLSLAALKRAQLAREDDSGDDDSESVSGASSRGRPSTGSEAASATDVAAAEADAEAALEDENSTRGDLIAPAVPGSRRAGPKEFDFAKWERTHAQRFEAQRAHFAEVDEFELEEDAGDYDACDSEGDEPTQAAPAARSAPPPARGGLEAILEANDTATVAELADEIAELAVEEPLESEADAPEQNKEVVEDGHTALVRTGDEQIEPDARDSAAAAAAETGREGLQGASIAEPAEPAIAGQDEEAPCEREAHTRVRKSHHGRRSSVAHRRSSVAAPPPLHAGARWSSVGAGVARRSSIAAPLPLGSLGRASLAPLPGRLSTVPALPELAEEVEQSSTLIADVSDIASIAEVPASAETREDTDIAAEEVSALPEDATPLQQLLHLCKQDESALPTLDDFVVARAKGSRVIKIGEGTFGEAFKSAEHVYKVMPIEGDLVVNGEHQKGADEVLGEAMIAYELSSLRAGGPRGDDTPVDAPPPATSGFIHCHAVGVCKGEYSPALLAAWDEFDEKKESENDRPGEFPPDQLYIVFAFADGGRDLEGFELRSFDEARGMLLQIAGALGAAEEAFAFEHRDLHWGNVLLSRPGNPRGRSKQPKKTLTSTEQAAAPKPFEFTMGGRTARCKTGGLHMQLIDFTLSRLEANGRVLFCNLEEDPEIFMGTAGVCQFDTYRRMRKVLRKRWESSNLRTNAMWMHYLADTLLTEKAQDMALSSDEERALRGFRKRALGYDCAGDAVRDELFDDMWLAEDGEPLGTCPL